MLPRRLICTVLAVLFCGVVSGQAIVRDGVDSEPSSAGSEPTAPLVDGPSPHLISTGGPLPFVAGTSIVPPDGVVLPQLAPELSPETSEPFHWKGLILQSLSFEMLQNVTRVMTASQKDRRILLNKPFWSDYWASLGQFNMRRWNDGDSIKVNYIGHPMQGAISGYIEVQNDPKGRMQRFGRDPEYWRSRYRAFLWSTVYSTWWEIGPLGETAIFNQGGVTYPIQCEKRKPQSPNYCERPDAKYTNNTGWVDFIITPIVGTLWQVGEDAIDRYVTDHLVEKHPQAFKYKVVRSSLNPTRSLANMLRGQYPWYRDYEHPTVHESYVHGQFDRILYDETPEHVDINLHSSTYGLQVKDTSCNYCRRTLTGAGVDVGIRLRRYIDFTTSVNVFPGASPVSTNNVGGTLTTALFGLRTGYYKEHYALQLGLAPGLATYSRAGSDPAHQGPSTSFAAAVKLSGDLYFSRHIGVRATVSQMLIRFKSTERDPPGIDTPPRLSFLSHENYINSTNWGVQLGPVIRF